MSHLPYMQFYPDRWLTEAGLRACSLAARGFWMDILCLMWKSPQRGVLKTGKKVWGDLEIATALLYDPKTAQELLSELSMHSVFSRRKSDGAMYCRRMVREERRRKQVRKAVIKHRLQKSDCNHDVSREKSEVRSHKDQSQNLTAPSPCGNVENLKAAAEKQISDAQEVLRAEPANRGARLAFDEGMGQKRRLDALVAPVAGKKAL